MPTANSARTRGQLLAFIVLCLSGTAPALATTLTFDIPPTDPNYCVAGCLPPNYGSRIDTTPNVVVSYAKPPPPDAADFVIASEGYGDLLNALGNVQYDSPAEIVLTPDPGYGVRVNSFQIATWLSQTYPTAIAIYDANGSVASPNLFSYSDVLSGPGSTSPLTSPVISFGPVRIYVSNLGSTGIDNLSFEQFQVDIALTLTKASVAGCKSVSGKITLPSPASPGGVIVSVSDTLASATPPATVTIAEGATSKSFTIKTAAVAANESGTLTVSLGSASSSQPLTVLPMGLSSVSLTPTSTVGGAQVVGKATLECNAGPGPILVDLTSSNAAAASPVAANIAVPQGQRSATFNVSTNAVQSKSYATISGTANGITKSKKLTVNVAASVSPTKLSFGSVPVGTSSGVLNAILTNNGPVAFAVASISPTGTNAKYYSQTNNCPANLAAGASCAIGVRFNPTVTGSKSAKLSIATSATSTPLSVSLSGTGI